MSSENRNSSAVRNLRSLFENKHSDSPVDEARGRSPNSLRATEPENGGGRRTSKVRASFVSVERNANMATLQPSESGAGRRGSFGEADGDLELKKSISQEPAGPSTAVSSAGGTPNLKPTNGEMGQAVGEKEAENPDKPVTGAEEEPKKMTPADPVSAEAVSGGQALPPPAEDLKKSTAQKPEAAKGATKKPLVNGTSKPAAISTKAPSKPANDTIKSPASVKTPTSATSASKPAKTESPKAQPAKAPLKKASRASLTAPTAASMARSGPGDKAASTATSKSKPREATKPISLPSHLTAPTASSRAKHEPETQPKPTVSNPRTTTASKSKPSTTTAKPSRSSLAPEHRPGSRTSQTSHTRRSVAPADGSFLERMMKPTAASASKTHEKTEMKSPPRQKAAAPSKPKTNGAAVKTAAKTDGKRISEGGSTAALVASDAAVADELSMPESTSETTNTKSSDVSKPEATQPEAATQPAPSTTDKPQEPAAVSEPVPHVTEDTEPTAETPKTLDPVVASGNEIPKAAGESAMGSAGLEATPAGLGSEETIR